jgi:predicted ATPase
MFIKSATVLNYKSFVNSGPIEFEPGVNLIVGENSSGKTALLEVLGGQWTSRPHVGKHATGSQTSTATLQFRFPKSEIDEIASRNNNQLLTPALGSPETERELIKLAISDHLDIYSRATGDGKRSQSMFMIGKDNRERPIVANAALVFDLVRTNGLLTSFSRGHEQGGAKDVLTPLVEEFSNNILFISARRIEVHTAQIGANQDRKTPIAENLAIKIQEQFNQHNYRFQNEYMKLIKRVVPQVKSVSPSIVGGANIALKISPYEPESREGSISHLLSESGTGVGQVLAMLFTVVYEGPSAIVIDEPNSFLHPRATRELLRIFKENTQHQYFISTHSPEVFSEVKPPRYTALSYVEGKTVAENLTYGDLADTFKQLGISPFFPYAMWVEGETEAAAFPLILRDPDVRFFPLRSADEIANNRKKKEIQRILDIYAKVVAAIAGEPLPTQMKVVVDGEHLNPRDIEDFSRPDEGAVKFIPRRMFENYLLDPEAVAHVLAEELGATVQAEEFAQTFAEARSGADESEWLRTVDGAVLLDQIFEAKAIPFKKTRHSIAITKWLLKERPNHLDELRQFLESVFPK